MSELPISSPYRSTPDKPVGDTERDQLNSRLNAAYESGQLDSDDYHARLDTLYGARTLGELVPVVTGLPAVQTYSDPAAAANPAGQPGELTPSRQANGLSVAVVGGVVGVVILIAILLIILL